MITDKITKFFQSVSNVFLLAIVAVISIILLTKSCNTNPTTVHVNDTKRAIDSIVSAWNKSDKARDAIAVQKQKQLDSINAKLQVVQSLLTTSQKKAVELATNVVLAKQNKDTVSFVEKCDSLAAETIAKDGIIQSLQAVLTVKDETIDSINAIQGNRLIDAQVAIAELKDSFDLQASRYYTLAKDYNKAVKKAGKKWTVSLGGGYGVTGEGKLQPLVGVFIGITIFRL